jgi:uncharacterized protein (DUF2336 family)
MSTPTQPRLDEPIVPLDLVREHKPQARNAIVQRLCEIVSWPESRIAAYERHLAADILVGLLRTSGIELRLRCAQGMVLIHDAPKPLLRYLARDEIRVARPLLEAGVGFDDSDLIATVRDGVSAHWLVLTRRRNLSESVTDALLQTGDITVMEAVLRNATARLSTRGVDFAVSRSRQATSLPPLLVARTEIRPAQALTLFWWANFESRQHILRRFAVDRGVLIQELGDVFAMAAAEGWSDADA